MNKQGILNFLNAGAKLKAILRAKTARKGLRLRLTPPEARAIRDLYKMGSDTYKYLNRKAHSNLQEVFLYLRRPQAEQLMGVMERALQAAWPPTTKG